MANGVGKILGPFSGLDCGAEGQADFRIGDFSALELGELRGDQRLKIVRCKEVTVSISRDGKARWHLDAVRTKITHHLSKGGILAPDGPCVTGADVLEPTNEIGSHFVSAHACSRTRYVVARQAGQKTPAVVCQATRVSMKPQHAAEDLRGCLFWALLKE